MNSESTKPTIAPTGSIDARTLGQSQSGLDADIARERAEQRGMKLPDGRSRRKKARTEVVSVRMHPEIRRLMYAMAEAENRSFIDIIEESIKLRHEVMKGGKSGT
jgi:hypothetical protein